ncbi:hypothetical protein [Streptomyces sp. NPDC058330]|uniref:hypothetical protein n=1 Tax=Streptomyces sp. NPDC058330 TaxID=3346449 RepID=UPI0036EC2742
MRATVVRRTALAASVVSLALLATACGGSDEDTKGDAKAPAAEGGGATKAAVKALTAAELEKVSLAQGDVAGHKIGEAGPEDISQPADVTADKKECEPVGHAFYAAQRGAPVGTAVRKVVQEPKKDAVKDAKDAAGALGAGLDVTTTLVTLASYDGDGAEKNLAELRESAAACAAGFTLSTKDGKQKFAKVTEAKVSGGEEALAWTLVMEEEGVQVPFKLVSLRQAGTVATFSSLNVGAAAGAVSDFELPSEVIAAQVKKLG